MLLDQELLNFSVTEMRSFINHVIGETPLEARTESSVADPGFPVGGTIP